MLHDKANTEDQLARSIRAGQGTNAQLDNHEDVTQRMKWETPKSGIAPMTSRNEYETMQNQIVTRKATPEVGNGTSRHTGNREFDEYPTNPNANRRPPSHWQTTTGLRTRTKYTLNH